MSDTNKSPPNHRTIDPDNQLQGVTLVPEDSRQYLNERQVIDYKEHRRQWIRWLFTLGKDPERGDGYAHDTVRRRACDTDVFYRWFWERNDGYTIQITHDGADDYCQDLLLADYSDSHRANIQKSLKCLFRWHDSTETWEPQITFSGSSNTRHPRDFLTRDERRQIEQAALEYDAIPNPKGSAVDTDTVEQWKNYLAIRLRKPADDVTYEDFQKVNGFKIPSIVYASLDAGLRPAEVGRARTTWVDVDNSLLRIPTEQATKHRDNWTIPIRDRTATFLEKWIEQQPLYDVYEDSDRLWLTREGEPYSSRSLKYILRKLCDIADIDYTNRKMTWYAVRHSTGTVLSQEEGLEAAAAQLRHSSLTTTRKYDQAPTDARRDALERL